MTSFCVCDVQFLFPVEPAKKIPWDNMGYLDALISDAVLMGCLTCSQKLFHVVHIFVASYLDPDALPHLIYNQCFLKPLSSIESQV